MTQTSSPPMPKRRLGDRGPFVSQYALGAMTFGAETDEKEAHRMLDLFCDRGGTMIDTADVYNAGASEEIIGAWGAARGGMDDLVIATKCRFGSVPGSPGASRRAITRCVEASLRRLRVDAIDLFFIHGWDRDTAVAETLETLGHLVEQGKIHHTGWSNVTGWQLERICTTAANTGLPRPVAVQPQYSLLERGIEWEVLPCALEHGVGLTPWSPLGGGWLTGKYKATEAPTGATRLGEDPGRGVEAYDIRNTDKTHAVLRVMEDVAARYDAQVSHVALSWLTSRPAVSSILLGARNAVQLADNLDAIALDLDAEALAALTKASAIGVPAYPYGFVTDWSGVDYWKRFGT